MQRNIKSYIIDGESMQFASFEFQKIFKFIAKEKKLSVLDFEEELGAALNVSHSAIHSWRFGVNGPSDVEIIKQLATCLGISDHKLLLKQGKDNSMQISERQKDSLKRIYDAVIEYLDIFQRTDGFNDYWYDFDRRGLTEEQIENTLYEIAEKELHKVELVVAKEYIELYKLPVYGQLEEYVCDVLGETYNGKLSYAYRFGAGVENIDGTRSDMTTSEDYILALKGINDLLEVYM